MNKVLRATLVSAVVITTVIGAASFVLSFAALWDLATLAGVPRKLSWLWPVIVDGTILQATISVIALAQFDEQSSGRKFFWWVLVIAALVSIGANALHAFISQSGSLYPALSAVIATVAPVSLLAATHGLGILVRVPVVIMAEPTPARVRDTFEEPKKAQPVPEYIQPVYTAHMSVAHEIVPAAARGDVATPASSGALIGVAEVVGNNSTVDPLDDVDRWILDRNPADDLYPVDAP